MYWNCFFHFVIGLGTDRGDYDWHIEAAHSNAEPHCSSASRRLTCWTYREACTRACGGQEFQNIVFKKVVVVGPQWGKESEDEDEDEYDWGTRRRGEGRGRSQSGIYFEPGIVLSEQSLRGNRHRSGPRGPTGSGKYPQ